MMTGTRVVADIEMQPRRLRARRPAVLRGVAFDLPANYSGAHSFALFRSAASLGGTMGFEEGNNIRIAVVGGRF